MIIISTLSSHYFTSLHNAHNHPMREAQLFSFSDEETRYSEKGQIIFPEDTQKERRMIRLPVQMGIKMSPEIVRSNKFS